MREDLLAQTTNKHVQKRAQAWYAFSAIFPLFLLTLLTGLLMALLTFTAELPLLNFVRLQVVGSSREQQFLPAQGKSRLDLKKLYLLLDTLPRTNKAPTLVTTNYPEDSALREATLSSALWEQTDQGWQYTATNRLQVYVHSSEVASQLLSKQGERTLLTARILLGLWQTRRSDPRFTYEGAVVVRPNEILEWRGVQKHSRLAYPGASKRFSDGYQWKHKQQVIQDLELLNHYAVRGERTIIVQGRAQRFPVDCPYLYLTPIREEVDGKDGIVGYLVSPGEWIQAYERHANHYLMQMDREILHLNPQNDRLALRFALYLSEQWRLHARTGSYKQPIMMADLLQASCIPVDKTNLTGRFVPRIEAALQKLHTSGIIADPALCLSDVETHKAQWGNDWLAAYWRILPPSSLVQIYTKRTIS